LDGKCNGLIASRVCREIDPRTASKQVTKADPGSERKLFPAHLEPRGRRYKQLDGSMTIGVPSMALAGRRHMAIEKGTSKALN
jgi:hypothetical protein